MEITSQTTDEGNMSWSQTTDKGTGPWKIGMMVADTDVATEPPEPRRPYWRRWLSSVRSLAIAVGVVAVVMGSIALMAVVGIWMSERHWAIVVVVVVAVVTAVSIDAMERQ